MIPSYLLYKFKYLICFIGHMIYKLYNKLGSLYKLGASYREKESKLKREHAHFRYDRSIQINQALISEECKRSQNKEIKIKLCRLIN